MNGVSYHRLECASDRRGDAFHIPQSVFDFMGTIEEMHFVTIEPGAVRGNHYHRARKEFMFVNHYGPWLLAWGSPDAQNTSKQEFDGRGGVIVEIASGIVHAVKNTGVNTLHIISCSDGPYFASDTERLMIIE